MKKNRVFINKIKLFCILSFCMLLSAPALFAQALPFSTSDHFAASGNCAMCHNSLLDAGGADVSIGDHWESSMMANAAKDPYYLAKVTSEVKKFPDLQSVIEDKCAVCHMPMARTQSVFNGEAVRILGEGYLQASHPLHVLARDGVSCTVCHQIQDTAFGDVQSFSGEFVIDQATAKPNRSVFSPFNPVMQEMMKNSTGFIPLFSTHIQQSALCATCHTLYTPYIDEHGEVGGEFPEQTPYLEWLHSGQSQSCQDCHMPHAAGPAKTANIPPNLASKSPFSQHHFVGGNAFMVNLIHQNSAVIGVSAKAANYQATVERIESQMREQTATVEIVDTAFDGDTLNVDLMVEVMTGHKYPTGFPSRRVWLHVTVLDKNGATVFESGQPTADGQIVGNDADADPTTYEPHYDLVQSPDQVQIYESVMVNTLDEVTYTLLRGARYVKDNRVLPSGFDKASAGSDFAVYGLAVADENFEGGADRIRYAIDVSGVEEPLRVTAELLYQSVSYPFLHDLEKVDTPEIAAFMGMVQNSDQTPTFVADAVRENIVRQTPVLDWPLR